MTTVAREVDKQFNSPESEKTKIIKLNEEDPEFVNAMEQLLLAPEAAYTRLSPSSMKSQSMREIVREQDASVNMGNVFMGTNTGRPSKTARRSVQSYAGHRSRRQSPRSRSRSRPRRAPDTEPVVVDLFDTNLFTDHSVLPRSDSHPLSAAVVRPASASEHQSAPHARSQSHSPPLHSSHLRPHPRSHSHSPPHPGSGALVKDHPHSRSEPTNLSSYDVANTFNRNFDHQSSPNSGDADIDHFNVFEEDYIILDSS